MGDPLTQELTRLRAKGDNDSLVQATELEREQERRFGTPEQRKWWEENGDSVEPATHETVDPSLQDERGQQQSGSVKSFAFPNNPLGDDDTGDKSDTGDAPQTVGNHATESEKGND